MNTEKLTWYAARSGGIVAWLLLALGLVLGLLLSSRVLGRRASPAWLLSIHRFLGGLSVIFTFVHVGAIMLDDFVSFGWTDVLVPWASEWNPGAVAWGIIAMYLAIAIELTSFAMRRLPRGVWRGVHWLSAPLFVVATVHGYQAGTDAGRAFIIAIVASCLVLAGLTAVRVVGARTEKEPKTDPRVLLEQAKARRAERAASRAAETIEEPTIAPAAHATRSWQPDPPLPVVAPDHAAEPDRPSPAWTDLRQPVADGADDEPFWVPTETRREEPASGEEPFWVPAEPATAPAFEPPPEPAPAFEPPPEPAPVFEPPPEPAPVFEPPPEPAPVFELPPEPAPVFEPHAARDGLAETFEGSDEPAPSWSSASVTSDTPQSDEQADRPVPELQHVGAPVDPTAPTPAWNEPDELAWLTADAGQDPTIRRREGPVPGVWKRSRRDLSDYISEN